MKKLLPFVGFMLTFFVLTGCEQPATEAPVETEAPAVIDAGGITSIDADGNIAPFGFASRQPVPVREPEVVLAATTETSAASSDIYNVHCIACHGADAQGVQGLGLNLVDSELVASSSEAELTAFLKVGRLTDSPDSVTGVPMPGFAWLGDEDLADVSGYLKSLND